MHRGRVVGRSVGAGVALPDAVSSGAPSPVPPSGTVEPISAEGRTIHGSSASFPYQSRSRTLKSNSARPSLPDRAPRPGAARRSPGTWEPRDEPPNVRRSLTEEHEQTDERVIQGRLLHRICSAEAAPPRLDRAPHEGIGATGTKRSYRFCEPVRGSPKAIQRRGLADVTLGTAILRAVS